MWGIVHNEVASYRIGWVVRVFNLRNPSHLHRKAKDQWEHLVTTSNRWMNPRFPLGWKREIDKSSWLDNQPFRILFVSELLTCEAKCSHEILVVIVQCRHMIWPPLNCCTICCKQSFLLLFSQMLVNPLTPFPSLFVFLVWMLQSDPINRKRWEFWSRLIVCKPLCGLSGWRYTSRKHQKLSIDAEKHIGQSRRDYVRHFISDPLFLM